MARLCYLIILPIFVLIIPTIQSYRYGDPPDLLHLNGDDEVSLNAINGPRIIKSIDGESALHDFIRSKRSADLTKSTSASASTKTSTNAGTSSGATTQLSLNANPKNITTMVSHKIRIDADQICVCFPFSSLYLSQLNGMTCRRISMIFFSSPSNARMISVRTITKWMRQKEKKRWKIYCTMQKMHKRQNEMSSISGKHTYTPGHAFTWIFHSDGCTVYTKIV